MQLEEDESIDDEPLPDDPREVIEYIRRVEYGVGAELTGEGAVILRKVKRKYGKLLSTVANELNSEDNHFLLELIQNAQDNKYSDDVEPTIKFKATPELLVVENNELGFTPLNVKSLCSAAESTKTDKTIYIGEKGIGFKSVFKVTDAPEIHSNGFHFRFEREWGGSGLGYILPHWYEPTIPINASATTLVLPAKPGFTFKDFSQLSPSLLLFLSKLRRIEIEALGKKSLFRRVDDSGRTRLLTEHSTDQEKSASVATFVMAHHEVSMFGMSEERRKGVQTSKVILAFPVHESGLPDADSTHPVFSFLPVADCGFRFIIHADFVLTSSRESIQETLPWNKRLRDAIAAAFIRALDGFKSNAKLRTAYFEFLPRKGEVKNEFFRAACTQLFATLRETGSVLCEDGEWRKPGEVLLAPPKFRELFPSTEVKELFGMGYPHPEINVDLLMELGCHQLLITEVCSVFSEHRSWFEKRPQGWRASFYAYLASIPNQSALTKELKELPCIPLTSRKLMQPDGKSAIFFPLSQDAEYGFEHELRVVQSGIYVKALKENPAVQSFFSSLGVQNDDPYAVIHSYILPRHQEQGFGGATHDTLIAHLRYVKERWAEYKVAAASRGGVVVALRTLRAQMYLGTKALRDGGVWQFRPPESLYLAREYNPQFALEALAEDVGELVVSDRYLSESERTSASALTEWRAFLAELGVVARPRVHRTLDGDATCAPEILKLLESPKKSVRKTLLEVFDRDWTAFEEFTKWSVTLGRPQLANRATQFIQQIRSSDAPSKRRSSFRVDQSYADVEEVRSFFGEAANYIDADLTNLSFQKACGITFRVDVEACLRRLREGKAGAKLSRDQLRHIFNRLEESWRLEHAAIDTAFRTEQLIPITLGGRTRWLGVGEVNWRSPASQLRILERLSPSLASRYPDHLNFFTKLLRVQQELALARWPDALALLPSIENELERRMAATAIYQRLSTELEKGGGKQEAPVWLSRFGKERLFLSIGGQLVRNSSKLFRGDVPELVDKFRDAPGIEFLCVAADQLPKVASILDAVGVRSLSASVEWRVAKNTTGEMNRHLTERVRSLVEPVARVVYWFGHARFKAAVQEGRFRTLGGVVVLVAKTLEMDALLEGHSRKTSGDAVLEGETLYLREGAPAAIDQVARELRKLFSLPDSATDIFTRLLLSNSQADSDEYLRIVKHIEPLPDAERQQLLLGAIGDEAESEFEEAEHRDTGEADVRKEDSSKESKQSAGRNNVDVAASPSESPSARNDSTYTRKNQQEAAGVEPSSLRSSGATGKPHSARGGASSTNDEGLMPDGAAARDVPSRGGTDTLQALEEALRQQGRDAAAETGLRFDVSTGNGDSPATRARTGRKKQQRLRKGRMLSYVEPVEDSEGRDAEEQRLIQERKNATDVAAIKTALASPVLTSRWRKLTEMPHSNPGYDIEAKREDGTIDFVEVKGKANEWGPQGVELTPREMEKAYLARDRYWLCIVENALSSSPRLYLIQGPYALTDRFCFDSNWKLKAVAAETAIAKPVAGMFVNVPGLGKGRIISVKSASSLSRLHILFDGGRQRWKLFEPGKMTLSKE